jgi:succinyl-CoA synthetase alpha subunit
MIPRTSRLRINAKLPRHAGSRSSFSSTRALGNYDATLKNLKIGQHTRVIFQGFTGTISVKHVQLYMGNWANFVTGRQATANAKESIQWGTNIVGGVTPGREGEHLGLPVLPTVRKVQSPV